MEYTPYRLPQRRGGGPRHINHDAIRATNAFRFAVAEYITDLSDRKLVALAKQAAEEGDKFSVVVAPKNASGKELKNPEALKYAINEVYERIRDSHLLLHPALKRTVEHLATVETNFVPQEEMGKTIAKAFNDNAPYVKPEAGAENIWSHILQTQSVLGTLNPFANHERLPIDCHRGLPIYTWS